MASAYDTGGFRRIGRIIADTSSVLGGLISIMVAIGALLWLAFRPPASNTDILLSDVARKHQLALGEVSTALTDINTRLMAVESKLGALAAASSENIAIADIKSLKIQLKVLDGRVREFEEVVRKTPDEILSLPMLARDVKDVRDEARRDTASFASEIERLYEFNKWFVALLLGMALTAMGNIFRGAAKAT